MTVALLLSVMLSAAATPAGVLGAWRHPLGQEPVDFIQFRGGVYLPVYEFSSSQFALGPQVGHVANQTTDAIAMIAEPLQPCEWGSPDGTAPFLPLGTPIHAVPGYATTFRLVVRLGIIVVLYEVVCSDEAKVGADLFDVYGRVQRIDIRSSQPPLRTAVIEDPATVGSMVDMLLAAPLVPGPGPVDVFPDDHPYYWVGFDLEDGTELALLFRVDRGITLDRDRIEVPAEFGEAMNRALDEQESPVVGSAALT